MASNGKVALVTGAGTGIGKSSVLQLLGDGYSVVLAGRRIEPLEETIAESGVDDSRAIAVSTDVGNPESVAELFEKAESTFGRLDVLFNNAGIGSPRMNMEDLPVEDWQRVVDTNLTGSFVCAQHAIKIMKNQSPQGGRIINNGSISAYTPRPDAVAYTTTKHAITGLTKQISLDGRKYNIACSQVDVGNAATPMTARMQGGVLQANGETMPEPTFNVEHVGETVLYISNLPLDANIQFVTIMATQMPYVGRG
ncbi:MAG: SDR family oxidoreductase [SAR202 cluster bacterium]|jgi:NAD(P)-dependent dehydrogenase (short-subunit alcohol dehydrogenase family)|nr:MAG: SDR family oxidoreductase [SAR202 cluster bacterium]KAA1303731.1 MAG: SDR family oxidoreductase [SAR202 cluster bacterium]MAR86451.1 3-oxoacyl-ACP reductase [Chloroflexota bacterium]MEC8987488.1 SDR family oxidoreductase [Chloroflexota bacterium]MEE3345827.1 SDR family oxidoreductase [Chloroflexota bacterium]|tara:strand:- start:1582 stop:2340 length:759 start_codon:yes stop_codon:yes gene_type:complete